MTRKHFEAVATAIQTEKNNIEANVGCQDAVEAIQAIANSMANVFAQANPRFNRSRFMTACGF